MKPSKTPYAGVATTSAAAGKWRWSLQTTVTQKKGSPVVCFVGPIFFSGLLELCLFFFAVCLVVYVVCSRCFW